MGAMQWLGVIPRENAGTYLAEALRGGTQGFMQGREMAYQKAQKAQEMGLKTREVAAGEQRNVLAEKEMAQNKYLKGREYMADLMKAKMAYKSELTKLSIGQVKDAATMLINSSKLMNKESADKLWADPKAQAVMEMAGIPVPVGAYGVPDAGGFGGFMSSLTGVMDRFGGRRTAPIGQESPRSNRYTVTPVE